MPLDALREPIVFHVEPWSAVVPEMRPVWLLHWREVARDHIAVPLAVGYGAYEELEAAGRLHVLTARLRGRLVGYVVTIVQPHLHYAGTLFGTFDLFYLLPELRRGWRGVQMFRAAERSLRARGVRVLQAGTKIHASPLTGKSLDAGPIFEFLGWVQTERVYRKLLESGE